MRKIIKYLMLVLLVWLSLKMPWKYIIEGNGGKRETTLLVASCLFIFFIAVIFFLLFFNVRITLINFIREMFVSRKLIFELSLNELKKRYLGSYFGFMWVFIQPALTILIFWFVFEVGFKSAPVENFPFLLWLMCGMIPWFFISESITSAASSIIDNSYLVKKVVFRVSLMPIVRILTAFYVHMFFVAIMFIMFFIYGYKPDLYMLQVIYYSFASFMLILGISWLTSSLVIFIKDVVQLIGIIIQFGFWLTPVFWSYKIMPEKYVYILKYNPAFYIVEGYRDSFINKVWFWEHYNLTINFWMITVLILGAGIVIFKKLRPHFADVI